MLFNRLNGKFQLTVNNRRRKTKLWITHKRDNRLNSFFVHFDMGRIVG
jgi:hypothetical protein